MIPTFYRIPTKFILHTICFFHQGGVPASKTLSNETTFWNTFISTFLSKYPRVISCTTINTMLNRHKLSHIWIPKYLEYTHICKLTRNYSEKALLQKWIQSPHSPSPASSSTPRGDQSRPSERRKRWAKAVPLVTTVPFRTLQPLRPVRPVQSLRWSFTLPVTAYRFASETAVSRKIGEFKMS